ncbi:MAG: putative zinc-binding protein [Candidatus Humimicrobiaceae bacterium]
MKDKKFIIIPCSGIGKPIGAASRETTYEIIKQKPDLAETVCLALLTSGDKETIKKINDNYCITLDGCAKHCAQRNTEACGKIPDKSYMILKFAAENKDMKPEEMVDIGEGGRALVKTISKKIIGDMDEILQNEKK